jgi:hypothetical protein
VITRKRAIILGFLLLYLALALQMPSGEWDAIAIWNLRAKFLYGLPHPLAAFAIPDLPHLDYPPLLPALVALGWKLVGSMTPWVPILLHGLVLVALLACYRRTWALLLVGGVALGYATYQYADLPLALSLTVAVLAYVDRRPLRVGAALGVGTLLKNEGLMIMLVFLAVWSVLELRIPWRAGLAVLPFVVALAVFKTIVPANDIMGSSGIGDRLMDGERYRVILPLLFSGLLQFGTGANLLLVAGLFLTRTPVRLSVPLLALLLIWCGYFLVYVITPNDLVWHITSSYDRLLLHLFPAGVLALTSDHVPTPTLLKHLYRFTTRPAL